MFKHPEIPIQVDVPVREEIVNGREVTIAGGVVEGDLVDRDVALAICNRVKDAASSGDVSQDGLCRLLSESDAPHRHDQGFSLEDLAQDIETARKVIAFLNAAELWDNVTDVSRIEANYPVLMEAVARDPQSQEIVGFMFRDPAAPDQPVFVDAPKMERSWLDAGGWKIAPSL